MEVSINGDTPAGWFIMEFMIWRYPYFRKHLVILILFRIIMANLRYPAKKRKNLSG